VGRKGTIADHDTRDSKISVPPMIPGVVETPDPLDKLGWGLL